MQSASIICSKCGMSNEPQTPYCVRCGNALYLNQPSSGPVYNNHPFVSLAPPPVQTHYGTFPPQPVAQMPPMQPLYSQPVIQRPRSNTKRNVIIACFIGISVLLLLIFRTMALIISHSGSSTYPTMVSAYGGTVHNNTVNVTTSLSLTSVVEDSQGNISGSAFVGQPLVGSGPFKGSVGLDKSVQFTVTPGENAGVSTIQFVGIVQTDGSMSGTYTVSGTGETGTWQVKAS